MAIGYSRSAHNGRVAHESEYPETRAILSSAFRDSPNRRIEAVVQETFGNVPIEDVESFWSTLGDIAKVAAPIAQVALPIVGTAVGGPLGGAVGGLAASALGAAAGGGAQPARPAAPGAAPVPAPQPGGGGNSAASQVIALLSQPQFLQALSAMVMGRNGRESIEVAGEPVEVGEFGNLLSVLSEAMMTQHHALMAGRSGVPQYAGARGEDVESFAEPEQRASALWGLLQRHESIDEGVEAEPEDDAREADRFLDELEMLELDEDEAILV